MWSANCSELSKRILQFTLILDGRPATYDEVIQGWQTDAKFRTMFNALLADVPFTAFRWETPPLTTASLTRSFEFVVLNSPGLDRTPDREPFLEHTGVKQTGAVAFSNLGGDARLVVPCSYSDPVPYGHLASFVRLAPASQHQELWQVVGEEMALRVNRDPVWLNTAGAGVSWLHVRLDDAPKYYSYAPYMKSE